MPQSEETVRIRTNLEPVEAKAMEESLRANDIQVISSPETSINLLGVPGSISLWVAAKDKDRAELLLAEIEEQVRSAWEFEKHRPEHDL